MVALRTIDPYSYLDLSVISNVRHLDQFYVICLSHKILSHFSFCLLSGLIVLLSLLCLRCHLALVDPLVVDVSGRGQVVGDGAVTLLADEARRLRVTQLEVDEALDTLRVIAERAREDLVQFRRLLWLRCAASLELLNFLFPIDDRRWLATS